MTGATAGPPTGDVTVTGSANVQVGNNNVNNAQQTNYFGPTPLPRSAYLDGVEALAPEILQQRESEVADLARFCRGDEPYVWWQAGPWAGKTALLAAFVLEPVDAVEMFHFFVRATRSDTCDSDAFTKSLLGQLGSYLDVYVGSLDFADRVQLLPSMLRDAADRAGADGARLILVIDGVDEDRGRENGRNLPSILSLLPAKPVPNLGVILAGRPHPEVPGDVATGHFVRSCPVRLLRPAEIALSLQREAKLELDTILHDAPFTRAVLGLVLAAGGDLTAEDLAELTGRLPGDVEALLDSTAGRTLARFASFGRPASYGFAHETLRAEAERQFGRLGLRSPIATLHTWADVYRQDGWPTSTPGYLFNGYPTMLAVHGETERLVRLAVDERRHRAMRESTGSDKRALEEVRSALSSLHEQDDPDVRAVGYLAREHWRLLRPSLLIPSHLPAVWAALDDVPRAVEVLESIMDDQERAVAEEVLFRTLLAVGNFQAVEVLARSVEDPSARAGRLMSLAEALIGAGALPVAEAVVLSIAEPELRQPALFGYVRALAEAGLAAEAEAAARSSLTGDPDLALLAVVERLLAVDEVERATLVLPSITGSENRVLATLEVAEHSFDRELYEEVYQDALGMLESDDAEVVILTLRYLAVLWGLGGYHDEAESAMRALGDEDLQSDAFDGLLDAYIVRGFIDRAERLAASPPEGRPPDDARKRLIRGLVAAGAVDDALRLAYETSDVRPEWHGWLEDSFHSGRGRGGTPDLSNRVWQLGAVAIALAEEEEAHPRLGEVFERAEEIALTVPDAEERAEALVTVALQAGIAGDTPRAERLLRDAAATLPDNPGPIRSAAGDRSRAGDDHLTRFALRLPIPDTGATEIYLWLAEALTDRGSPGQACAAATDAITEARAEEDPGVAGAHLARAALVLAVNRSADHARATALEAEEVSQDVLSPEAKDEQRLMIGLACAQIGDFPRAEALLAEMADGAADELSVTVASQFADSGAFSEALRWAGHIRSDLDREEYRLSLCRAAAATGDAVTTWQAALTVENPGPRARAFAAAANTSLDDGDAATASGAVQAAIEMIPQIVSIPDAAEVAGEVAVAAVRLGMQHEADELLYRQPQSAMQVTFLASLASGLHTHGDESSCRVAAQRATTLALAAPNPADRVTLLVQAAGVWADLGDTERVLQLADTAMTVLSQTHPKTAGDETYQHADIQAGIMLPGALIKVGEIDRARNIIDQDPSGLGEQKRLHLLSGGLSDEGWYREAQTVALAIPAEKNNGRPHWVRYGAAPDLRDQALQTVAAALAKADQPGQSEAAAAHITHPVLKAHALTDVVEAYARTGDRRLAIKTLTAAWSLGEWAGPLRGLGAIAPELLIELLEQ